MRSPFHPRSARLLCRAPRSRSIFAAMEELERKFDTFDDLFIKRAPIDYAVKEADLFDNESQDLRADNFFDSIHSEIQQEKEVTNEQADQHAPEERGSNWQSYSYSTSTVSRGGRTATFTRRGYQDSEGRNYEREEKSDGVKLLSHETRTRNGDTLKDERNLEDVAEYERVEMDDKIAQFEREWQEAYFGHQTPKAAIADAAQ